MANYYGYSTGGTNQSYGVSNHGSYGGTLYGVQQTQQPQQQSTYIAPAHQVQQTQTAYVTYGHQQQQQQPSYNNNTVSQTRYYQGSSNTSANVSASGYYSTNRSQIKSDPQPQTQLYQSSATGSYSQQQLATVKQVSVPATTRVQPSSQISFVAASKPLSATVISTSSTSTTDYNRQQSISNYEKALISAATSIYQQQRKGGGGVPAPSFTKTLPYWKQKRLQAQQNRDPNKPIVASEVKAYLYAWLGKERTRPEYNITAHGNSPFRQTYVCEVVAPSFNFVAKGAASNKKDAQTRAAWEFCDFLVREGKMKEEELPTRENKFKAANNKLPASYQEKDQKQVTEVIAKKKLVTKKIDFVGGSTLHLTTDKSPSTASCAKTTAVSYPTVAVDQAPAKAPVTKTVIVQQAPTKVVEVATAPAAVPKALSANDVDVSASKNSPIGESYVEQVWTDGRVIRFRCKLCECEFNDPSAKELHVRGRRHRLSYKKKVDPSIEVDVKLNPKQRSMMMLKMRQEARKDAIRQQQKQRQMWKEEMKKQKEAELKLYEEELWHEYQEQLILYEEQVEFHRRRNLMLPAHLFPPTQPILKYYQPHIHMRNQQQMKTMDDQHVTAKHTQIYPTEEELAAVQTAVQHVEGALKEVSGAIHEQELKVSASLTNNHFSSKRPQAERLLKAVLRIGALAKGLLLRGDLSVKLVLMCNEKPTVGMLTRVADQLPKFLGKGNDLKFSMKMCVEESSILLATSNQPVVHVQVILTATLMRTQTEEGAAAAGATKATSKPDPPDILDRQKCCLALAALRHAKWFQAKANGLQSCLPVTRIMKDLCVRVPTWAPLSAWAVELLVERAIASAKLPMSPSAALQRVFEAISSGVLLPGGPGLLDPCEREPTDAAGALTSQEREDITASAQHALRLMAFRSIHKVLGIDSLAASSLGGRKRPNNQESGSKTVAKQEHAGEAPNKRGKLE